MNFGYLVRNSEELFSFSWCGYQLLDSVKGFLSLRSGYRTH